MTARATIPCMGMGWGRGSQLETPVSTWNQRLEAPVMCLLLLGRSFLQTPWLWVESDREGIGRRLWPVLSHVHSQEPVQRVVLFLAESRLLLLCQLLEPHAGKPVAAGSGFGDQTLDVVSVTFMFNVLFIPSLWQDTIITELVLCLPITPFFFFWDSKS